MQLPWAFPPSNRDDKPSTAPCRSAHSAWGHSACPGSWVQNQMSSTSPTGVEREKELEEKPRARDPGPLKPLGGLTARAPLAHVVFEITTGEQGCVTVMASSSSHQIDSNLIYRKKRVQRCGRPRGVRVRSLRAQRKNQAFCHASKWHSSRPPSPARTSPALFIPGDDDRPFT
jgi:hypothetical protein